MNQICRKDSLARNMNRMLKLFPQDYNVFPRTWCLPAESVSTCNVVFFFFFVHSFAANDPSLPPSLPPRSYSDFQAYARTKKSRSYICKPDAGCQGRGIFITKSCKDIPQEERMICQVYVSKASAPFDPARSAKTHTGRTGSSSPPQPFLIDGYKFDLRVYVLVTSCDPLGAFVFEEGLVRFCTAKYSEPAHGNVVRNIHPVVSQTLFPS